jgi:hypothetical protein
MDLLFILQSIVYPVMVSLLLAITTPYAAVVGIMPLLGNKNLFIIQDTCYVGYYGDYLFDTQVDCRILDTPSPFCMHLC